MLVDVSYGRHHMKTAKAMKQAAAPDHCKGCLSLSMTSILYGPWCCHYGDKARAKVSHCKVRNAKRVREV